MKQDRLSDAQRDYVDTIRGGVMGALNDKEVAYALDSFLNQTPVDKVVDRILADRDARNVDFAQARPEQSGDPTQRH